MKRTDRCKYGWAIGLMLPLLVACSSAEEELESLRQPCRITIDLGEAESRLVLSETDGVITSTWGKKNKWDDEDGLTVVNLADNKTYTFMLVEGSGTSRGVFESDETPVDAGAEYMVYYPYRITDERSFGRFGQYGSVFQYYDRSIFESWGTSKISMRHCVAHYSDIRFTDADYQTEVVIDGKSVIRTTKGSNFDKTTIMKVKAYGFPESFVPVSMKLKPYQTDLTTFWQGNDKYAIDDVSVSFQQYPSVNYIEAYMPLSYRDIVFPAGSWLRASFVGTNGKTYYSDKVFEKETVMSGGKLLILNYPGEWKVEYDPNYDPDNQNSAEWEEIIR